MPDFYTIQSIGDGQTYTVSDLVGAPDIIPRRLLDMMDQRFIADQLLRTGPQAKTGVTKFYQSNPLYTVRESEVVGEFGQVPMTVGQLGQLMLAIAAKRALGVRVSIEMRDENDLDAVNLQLTQVTNTMVRDWDGVFMAACLAACAESGNTVAASEPWGDSTASTRKDIVDAKLAITSAVNPGTTNNYLGYVPDTIVLNVNDVALMEGNDDTWKAWVGNVAGQSPAVTGQLPNQLYNLDPWQTYHIPSGTALVCQRKTIGFISDTRPLFASPLEWHGAGGEYWESYSGRKSAIGIDQPLAMCLITGIEA